MLKFALLVLAASLCGVLCEDADWVSCVKEGGDCRLLHVWHVHLLDCMSAGLSPPEDTVAVGGAGLCGLHICTLGQYCVVHHLSTNFECIDCQFCTLCMLRELLNYFDIL